MQLDQFKTFFPQAKEAVYWAIETFILNYKITNLRMFLAQVSEESGRFTQFTENLNYSAPRLQVVWPSHFNEDNAAEYAYQPEKLANMVYANRLGNGDVTSGDGWKFKGRGAIQLTGRNLYTQFADYIHDDVDKITAYIETSNGAIESACWYWMKIAKVGGYTSRDDMVTVTRVINGGLTNLQARYNEFDRLVI